MEGEFYKFEKQNLGELIKRLKKKYQVWAPVKKDGLINFESDAELGQIELAYAQSHLGVKKIFFPPEEILFETKKGQSKIPAINKPQAIIGVHPVDLIGLERLDESFSQAPADFYWQRKRQNSLLIGITPLKPNRYFLDSLGNFKLVFDLFFWDQAKRYYLAEARSKKGEKLVKSNLFSKTNLKPKPAASRQQLDPLLSDPLKISKIIENSRKSKIWQELGKICLNCGICTYVCPLCYCFTTADTISAGGDSCQRCRHWDACTLSSFSQISGGYNFRPQPQDRLYNWFYHKFVRAVKERGKIDCLGCHRCTDFCPAGIDFRKIIRQLAKEQKIT